MRKNVLCSILLCCILLLPVSSCRVNQSDWQATIDVYAEGHTYCIIGEKTTASDGIDGYDVPHPPFQPPGRAFVFIRQPSFPNPYKNIWMEYRRHTTNFRVWNLTTYYVPMDEEGTTVLLQWNISQLTLSGYKKISLVFDGQTINMFTTDHFSFYSGPYQMTNMKIIMKRFDVI